MSAIFPTRSIALLMAIGWLDLISTALLHQHGLVTEMNPLMRVFIERGEWHFAAVKGATLIAAWVAMVWYCKFNRQFVRQACLIGSAAYMTIWSTWFVAGMMFR